MKPSMMIWGGGGGGGDRRKNLLVSPVAPFEIRSIVYAPQIPYKWAPCAGINLYAHSHYKSLTTTFELQKYIVIAEAIEMLRTWRS